MAIGLIQVGDQAGDGTGPAGPWPVHITSPGGVPGDPRPMGAFRDEHGRVWPMPDPSTRAPTHDDSSWDRSPDDFLVLAQVVGTREATAGQARDYGRHLFDALIGPEGWATLRAGAGPGPLVIGLRWGKSALHQCVWELLHDGDGYLSLRESQPVVLLRLSGQPGADPPATIERLPRVLFAVGAPLFDRSVRAGAEVMGVLRGIERGGGSASHRVLAPTSLTLLGSECDRFKPDIVHLIGHGRWDPEDKVGRLTFQADSGTGDEEHSGAEVAGHLGKPTMVIVSACESGVASSEAGSPLAADLVEGGAPIVIAMSGAISDRACRVFTRVMAAAVARGLPLVQALAKGRRIAFAYTQSTPEKVDWALPAVFTRAPLDAGYRLVNREPIDAMWAWIERQEHQDMPLFAGRHGLLADLDDLLVPARNPGVLLLYSRYAYRVGGTRALLELSAEAMRLGHLPVRIGPFQQASDAPCTFEALIFSVARQLVRIADREGVEPPQASLRLLAGSGPGAPGPEPSLDTMLGLDPLALPTLGSRELVQALRADLDDLRDRVAQRLSLLDPTRPPVLLLDDAHLYGAGLERLFGLLGAQGLGDAPSKLPVVVYGKEGTDTPLPSFGQLREQKAASGSVRQRELHHVADLPDEAYGVAFLCWMLNPTGVEGWPADVLAPSGRLVDAGQWIDFFHGVIAGKPFYDPGAHAKTVTFALKYKLLVQGDDDAILKANEMM